MWCFFFLIEIFSFVLIIFVFMISCGLVIVLLFRCSLFFVIRCLVFLFEVVILVWVRSCIIDIGSVLVVIVIILRLLFVLFCLKILCVVVLVDVVVLVLCKSVVILLVRMILVVLILDFDSVVRWLYFLIGSLVYSFRKCLIFVLVELCQNCQKLQGDSIVLFSQVVLFVDLFILCLFEVVSSGEVRLKIFLFSMWWVRLMLLMILFYWFDLFICRWQL